MKNRPARVRELIQRELGAMLTREMTFDATLVTVQGVDLTADFKHCHVYVGVLGSELQQRDVIHRLAERRPLLQHDLSKRVVLKFTPQLHFHLDKSVERGTKVMEIMRQVDEITPPGDGTTAPPLPANLGGDDEEEDVELADLDAEEADTELTPDEAAQADAAEADEDAAEVKETKTVRHAKDAKGRGNWHEVKPVHRDDDHDHDE